MAGELSDKVLLKIFRYFLDVSPRHWPRLVHTCRKWRRIVFASHRALQLRLFCTHGTPVQKILRGWPAALHIAVEYGGSPELYPPAPIDENNIMALLKQSGRVTSIGLTVTPSLLKKLSAIKRQFSVLEDLILLSPDSVPTSLPKSFHWGPRLRCLRLSRIAFPAFLPLLYRSSNLVDLQLHDVLNPWPISPEEFTNILAGMVQLRSLSLHLLSGSAPDFISSGFRNKGSIPSSSLFGERVVLHFLNRLDFRGNGKYLGDLVARINAPLLEDIEITFTLPWSDAIFGLPNLSQFINRIEMHKSHPRRRADIQASEGDITISLMQAGAFTGLRLALLCESLLVQLPFMAQICTHFSALLANVEDLRIYVRRPSTEGERLDGDAWLDIINSFTCVKWFHTAENILTVSLHAMHQSPYWQRKTVLPALYKLYISQAGPPHSPLTDEIVSLMISRRLSSHTIAVEYEQPSNSELREIGTMYASCHCHYLLTRLDRILFSAGHD